MDFENWDRRPNGDIQLGPLLGWEFGSLPMTGLMRIETAQSEEQLKSGEVTAVQVAMTVPQMRELGQALLKIADRLDQLPNGTRQ